MSDKASAIYFIVGIVDLTGVVFMCVFYGMDNNYQPARTVAQARLLSPLWPILMIVWLVRSILKTFKVAFSKEPTPPSPEIAEAEREVDRILGGNNHE